MKSWVAGKMNPAETLTNTHAGETTGLLEEMLTSGTFQVDFDNMRNYGKVKHEET